MASLFGCKVSHAPICSELYAFSTVPAQIRGERCVDRGAFGFALFSRAQLLCQDRYQPVVPGGQNTSYIQVLLQKRVRGPSSSFMGFSLLDSEDRGMFCPKMYASHSSSALETSADRPGAMLLVDGDDDDLYSNEAGDSAVGFIGSTMSAAMADASCTSSFLQCVGCGAVYAVDSEELEGEPRVVRCCTCLHEWYACEADLLWGDQEAAAAIETPPRERSAGKAISMRDGATVSSIGEETVVADDIDDFPDDEESNMNFRTGARLGSPKVSASPFLRKSSRISEIPKNEWHAGSPQGSENPDIDEVFDQSRILTSKAKLSVETSGLDVSLRSSKSSTYSSSRKSNSELSSSSIFVGNLSFRATEEDVFRAFSGYGIVIKCQIPMDELGGSRGFGFVEMAEDADAERAMDALQGASILGRDIFLSKARRRRDGSDQKIDKRYESTTDEKYEYRSRSVNWEEDGGSEESNNAAKRSGWSSRYSYSSSVREYASWSSSVEKKGKAVTPPRPNGDDVAPGTLTPKEEDKISSIFRTNASRARNRSRSSSRTASETDGRRGSGDARSSRRPGSMTDRRRGNDVRN